MYKTKFLDLKQKLNKKPEDYKNLMGLFPGKTALIISAGPSAIHWEEVYDVLADKKPIVICVKQAIHLAKDACDMHFVNWCNLENYSELYREHKNILSVYVHDRDQRKYGHYDIEYIHEGKCAENPEYISGLNRDYDNFSIEKLGRNRFPGPSIMLDSVLPTMVYMGIKEIYTVGWDLGDIGENVLEDHNIHFYDKGPTPEYSPNIKFENFKEILKKIKLFDLFKGLKKSFSFFPNTIKFHSGKMLNTKWQTFGYSPLINQYGSEVEIIKDSLPSLFSWLEEKEISIRVVTPSPWFNLVEKNRVRTVDDLRAITTTPKNKLAEFKNINYRKMSKEDLEILTKEIKKSSKKYKKYFDPDGRGKSFSDRVTEAKKDRFYALTYKQNLAGYFSLRGLDEGYGTPRFGVFVLEKYSNKGIANYAVRNAMVLCGKDSPYMMDLKVNPENSLAYKLYKDLGFDEVPGGSQDKNGEVIMSSTFSLQGYKETDNEK